MWGGDSDTDWEKGDGLRTVIPQALSAGISGQALWGTDIAGYMTFGLTRPSSKELYIRWFELASLLPIMRTHHGTARPRNWHWTRDEETLRIFSQCARLHAVLVPFLFPLFKQPRCKGLPMVRPLFLETGRFDLDDIQDQFMLGSDLMAAPVVTSRTRRRSLAVPSGEWMDWWTGQVIQGPARRQVAAPLGRRATPEGARVWNPAFDVTPAALVTGIITEGGVLRAPYPAALASAVATARQQRQGLLYSPAALNK